MAASPSSYDPAATAQRRLGHALGDRLDRLADAVPALDVAGSAIKAVISPVASPATRLHLASGMPCSAPGWATRCTRSSSRSRLVPGP